MHCGEGNDHVQADQFDQVDNDCERVDRRDVTSLDEVDDRDENQVEARELTTVRAGTVARPCQPTTSPRTCRVAPSILSADFARLGAQVEGHGRRRAGHPRRRHGRPLRAADHDRARWSSRRSPTWSTAAGGAIDVHLMIERPERHVAEFAEAGADSITIHDEATPHVHYALQAIRDAGCRAGLAINPGTPADAWRAWRRRSTSSCA